MQNHFAHKLSNNDKTKTAKETKETLLLTLMWRLWEANQLYI